MKKFTLLITLSFNAILFAQDYTEFATGSATDVDTNHESGICLMGGLTENDEAMTWFLERTDGGDVVVLRTSGSDGYNDYFFTDLGVTINSVTTFVIDNENGAIDPYVLGKVADAEAIWFAGGDQWNYVDYFKDNAMETALNNFINVKQGVIGGTSAGMAILGSSYFSAENGTVDSDVALSNPYHPRVTIGSDDFLDIPFMENTITDTHFENRDQEGRASVFLARMIADNSVRSFGIACNEYTAVCVDSAGEARVYGEIPAEDIAFFMQANCTTDYEPETMVNGTPVTWDRNGEAIKVYKIAGDFGAPNSFDLTDWETASGGTWENWSIDDGIFTIATGASNPQCAALSVASEIDVAFEVFPNPFNTEIKIQSKLELDSVKLYDSLGRAIDVQFENQAISGLVGLKAGIYILKIASKGRFETHMLIKK